MTRIVLTILLPLLLPIALYLLWLLTAGRAEFAAEGAVWRGLPWTWLVLAGIILSLAALFAVVETSGSRDGTYVPPHLEGGRIVPGHFMPDAAAAR